jgi:hypothetical protein
MSFGRFTQTRPLVSSSRETGFSFNTFFILIFWLEVLLSGHTLEGFPGPDRYFAYQWTMSYSHGISRRAFLGEVLHLLHFDNGNYLLITIFSWIITALIYWMLVKSLKQLLAPVEPITRVFMFTAILLSPLTTGILIATTGDPIQVVLLATIALSLLLLKKGRSLGLIAVVFFALGATSVLIHEASIFFVGPMLVLLAFYLRRSNTDRVALAGFVAGALPALLFILHVTANHPATNVVPMHLGSTLMVSKAPFETGSFSALLAKENAAHFHSGIRGYILSFRNLVGALALPVFFAFVLNSILAANASEEKKFRRRYLIAVFLPLMLSSPLWVIGHDWGRFSSFLFVLSLVALTIADQPTAQPELVGRVKLTSWMLPGLLLVLAGVTSTRQLPQYIVKGLGDDNFTMLAVLTLCLVGGWILFRTSRTAQI